MVDFEQCNGGKSQHVLQLTSHLHPTALVFEDIVDVEEDYSVNSETSSGDLRNADLSDEEE